MSDFLHHLWILRENYQISLGGPTLSTLTESSPLPQQDRELQVGHGRQLGLGQALFPRVRVSREQACSRMFCPGLPGCVGKGGRPKSTCKETSSAKVKKSRQPVSRLPDWPSLAGLPHPGREHTCAASGERVPTGTRGQSGPLPHCLLLLWGLYQVCCCLRQCTVTGEGTGEQTGEGSLSISKRTGPGDRGASA